MYVQVAYILENPETIKRELSPLNLVKDNWPKYLITKQVFLTI